MNDPNIERANLIINEVGYLIIGCLTQFSVDWDYVCYVHSFVGAQFRGSLTVFNKKQIVNFKSQELVQHLNVIFESYKLAMRDKLPNQVKALKYVINDTYSVDLKKEYVDTLKWEITPSLQPNQIFTLLID